MKKLLVFAVAGALLAGSAAQAQVVDPQTSRDIGRAVGQAAVAAQRAAEEARIAAREAMRQARRGFAEGAMSASSAPAPALSALPPPPPIASEDQAVDACAMAAEDRGFETGFRAVVRDIQGVDRRANGWDVDGVMDARRSWRDRPETWGFRCSVRDGQVANIDIGHDFARR
ncbi:MAG: hypothetical protein JSS55_12230 [Proteobacteria bacterium]|nr:hypothetical protein [Pseudomonadota bacterium]